MFNILYFTCVQKNTPLAKDLQATTTKRVGKTTALVLDLLVSLSLSGLGIFLMFHGGVNALPFMIPGALLQGGALMCVIVALVFRNCTFLRRAPSSISLPDMTSQEESLKKRRDTSLTLSSDSEKRDPRDLKSSASTKISLEEFDKIPKKRDASFENLRKGLKSGKPHPKIDPKDLANEFREQAEILLQYVVDDDEEEVNKTFLHVFDTMMLPALTEEERKERAICCLVGFKLMAISHAHNPKFSMQAISLDFAIKEKMKAKMSSYSFEELQAEVDVRVAEYPEWKVYEKKTLSQLRAMERSLGH